MAHSVLLSWWSVDVKNPQKLISPEKLSNLELILRCQQDNCPERKAFTELLRRHQSHVDRLLYHLAPEWSDRADLAQEVWIRVYRSIKKLQEPVKFKGWLTRITTNLFYDELRKRNNRYKSISLDAPISIGTETMEWELPSEEPTPEEYLATNEFYGQLKEAINQLPEVFRSTIVFREIEGMSYEKIAQLTGVSVGTVKSRIARARAKLQSAVQGYWEGN